MDNSLLLILLAVAALLAVGVTSSSARAVPRKSSSTAISNVQVVAQAPVPATAAGNSGMCPRCNKAFTFPPSLVADRGDLRSCASAAAAIYPASSGFCLSCSRDPPALVRNLSAMNRPEGSQAAYGRPGLVAFFARGFHQTPTGETGGGGSPLGDDSFEVREQATRDLLAAGRAAGRCCKSPSTMPTRRLLDGRALFANA